MKTLLISTIITFILGALTLLACLIMMIWHVDVPLKEIALTGLVTLCVGIIQLLIVFTFYNNGK